MSKGTLGLAGGVILALLLFAGCGSSSGDEPLTHAEFLKQGNAICKKRNDEREKTISEALGKLAAEKKKTVVPDEKKKILLEIIPFFEQGTEELKELEAPEKDEEKVEAIIEAREKAAQETRDDLDKFINSRDQYKVPNELSTEFGLERCYQ
ncbi:MAG TPA: hypothetical protein VFJ61_13510 [Solirubrobacterales bacterium]|nr:hypothetical protein [Solirubrobacterales bacterium]